jgi:hypothetical protein
MASSVGAFAVVLVPLLALVSCDHDRDLATVTFDPKMDVFNPQSEVGTSAREFTCTAKDHHGECVQRECKQGPGGQEFDCASYAAACVQAGFHWSGTKEGGKCSKVL